MGSVSGDSPLALASPEVRLVPLERDHAPGLLAHIDETMWAGMLTPQPRTIDEAVGYVEAALAAPGRIPLAVLDAATGALRGTTSFYDLEPGQGRVEIGYTFYGRPFWGGRTNPWCKLLMLGHAFERWRLHRVAFRCDVRNTRSAAAIERLGAVREGVLRGHRLAADGVRSDSVSFSILAGEWPDARAMLEDRLGLRSASPPPA